MSETKHTPGPWSVAKMKGRPAKAIMGADGTVVAKCLPARDASTGHHRVKPNARMIAAAPELLEALEEARVWVELCEDLDKDIEEPLRKIDAAIAKARET